MQSKTSELLHLFVLIVLGGGMVTFVITEIAFGVLKPPAHVNPILVKQNPKAFRKTEKVQHDTLSSAPIQSSQEKYDVLINSYRRCGSSFLGRLLGHRQDSFYFYEPLFAYGVWEYFSPPDVTCDVLEDTCKSISSYYFKQRIQQLNSAVTCGLPDMQLPLLNYRVESSGPSWETFRTCIRNINVTKLDCARRTAEVCRNSTHRVTKTLRITAIWLENLLIQNQRLKVIHLYRDPRAVLNSAVHTKWYPMTYKNLTKVKNGAQNLCKKMVADFLEVRRLMKLFPNRLKFVYLEEFAADMTVNLKALNDFLGMSFDDKLYKKMTGKDGSETRQEITDPKMKKTRNRNKAFWWRTFVPLEFVQTIDSVCQKAYGLLGYQSLNSDALRNLTVPSFHRHTGLFDVHNY